jgi:hypothetical protein
MAGSDDRCTTSAGQRRPFIYRLTAHDKTPTARRSDNLYVRRVEIAELLIKVSG